MNLLVIQYENRNIHFINELLKINKKYCLKHNIDYIFSNANLMYPPYWQKVYEILDAMQTHNNKYILWLDSDATIGTIKDMNIFIDDLFENDAHDMVISNDMFPYRNPFNAGVWVIRNNEISKQIITDWLSQYDQNRWEKIETNKFICDGQWAGIDYEQGSFTCNILPKYRNHIRIVNWRLLNNPYFDINQEYIFHFAGEFHKLKIEKNCESIIKSLHAII